MPPLLVEGQLPGGPGPPHPLSQGEGGEKVTPVEINDLVTKTSPSNKFHQRHFIQYPSINPA